MSTSISLSWVLFQTMGITSLLLGSLSLYYSITLSLSLILSIANYGEYVPAVGQSPSLFLHYP